MKSMTMTMTPGVTPAADLDRPRWRDQQKLRAVRRALRALIPKPGDR